MAWLARDKVDATLRVFKNKPELTCFGIWLREDLSSIIGVTFGTPFSNGIAMAFSEGAKWMLEKAIDWLQYHVNDYLFDDGTPERPWLKCKSEMFDDFKKAMEN